MRFRFNSSTLLRVLVLFLLPFVAAAQDPDAFTVKKWRPDTLGPAAEKYLILGLGSGIGFSSWRHEAKNVYQSAGANNLLFPQSPAASGYLNLAQSSELTAGTIDGSQGVSERTTVTYQGRGRTIPVNLDLLYNIGKFRFGATVGYDFFRTKTLSYKSGTYEMQDLQLEGKRSVLKYGLQLEFMFLDLESWRFGVQAKGGMHHLFGNYSSDLTKKGRLMFGGGLVVEKPLNEALIAYAAPSYEHRTYQSNTLESGVEAANTIGTVFLQVGIRARLDNLFAKYPLCPIPSCHVRTVHKHSKGTYRGQPWFKKQRVRVGENLPNEKKMKNGKLKVKKPYVEKDPKKMAEKSAKRQSKKDKKQEKEKDRVLKINEKQGLQEPGKETEGIGEDNTLQDPKKEKKKRKKKKKGQQEEAPAAPAGDEDDE